MSSFQILTHNHSKRIVEIKILDFFLSDPVQTVWFGSLTHSGTLAFQTWIEIWLVFSLQVGPKSSIIFVVLYNPEIPPKVTGLVTLSGGRVGV